MRGTFVTMVALPVVITVAACDGGGVASRPEPVAEVDAVFASYANPDSPGCAVGILEDGEIAYRRGYGMADLEHGVAIDADSVFRVGSLSQQFTAAVVLLLEQSGELAFDDHLGRWLPQMREPAAAVTIENLLRHTSGVRDYRELRSLAGYRDQDYYTAEDVLEFLARQSQLEFVPGTRRAYSTSNYFLLGQIVERVTSRSLAAVAQELIFGPLGMTDTHFHDDAGRVVPRRASGYAPRPGGFVASPSPPPIVGDGGVFTSVNDLLAWQSSLWQNRLGNGGAELVEWLLKPGSLADGSTIASAAGPVHERYRGLRVSSHSGASGGYRASVVMFPDQRFSLMTLCNVTTADPRLLSQRVADTQLAALEQQGSGEAAAPAVAANEPPADPFLLPVSRLRHYEGRYANVDLGAPYLLQVRDGRLIAVVGALPPAPLSGRSAYLFETKTGSLKLRFDPAEDGSVRGFWLDGRRVTKLWFERVR